MSGTDRIFHDHNTILNNDVKLSESLLFNLFFTYSSLKFWIFAFAVSTKNRWWATAASSSPILKIFDFFTEFRIYNFHSDFHLASFHHWLSSPALHSNLLLESNKSWILRSFSAKRWALPVSLTWALKFFFFLQV